MKASPAFLTRVAMLAKALVSIQAASARISYAGCNDEGYIDEVVYLDAEGNTLSLDIGAPVDMGDPDEEATRGDLDDALEEFAFEVIELSGNDRFDECFAGGMGSVTLTCSGKLDLNHGTNEIITHYKAYALQGDQVCVAA